jgi:crotonobetainyl-CoA:carnitine CoA-transferase CaiB-like acyl-CoA transferase
MTAAIANTGALEGIRIVDLTQMLAGPYCTMMLADQGAEVIKVEPFAGDYVRQDGPFRAEDRVRAFSGYFASVNRNKKSIAIDLKTKAGRELLIRLCESADAVVENFRVGVMDRLKLSYEFLRERNPKLVYASVRGFGDPRTGRSPYADWPAYDVVAQAMGGVIGINGPNHDSPTKVGPGVGDIVPGAMAAFGVVCAILNAQRTGRGQYVDVAMVDVILSLCERIVYQRSVLGDVARPEGNRHPMFALFGMVPAKDGWITLAAHTDDRWKILCELLNCPELIDDSRTATRPARVANQDVVYGEIGKRTSHFTKRELLELIGGKLPFAPVNDIDDIIADPHFAARDMLVEVDQPGCNEPVMIAGVPIKMTETPGGVRRRAPILGEDTNEILVHAGYSAAEIEGLLRDQVVK